MGFVLTQRVIFRDRENPVIPTQKHMIWMVENRYGLLNARDEHGVIKPITGMIVRVENIWSVSWEGIVTEYIFRPDGYESESAIGFEVPQDCLSEYSDSMEFPITVVNGLGEPI